LTVSCLCYGPEGNPVAFREDEMEDEFCGRTGPPMWRFDVPGWREMGCDVNGAAICLVFGGRRWMDSRRTF
jgi:hypothetical protein